MLKADDGFFVRSAFLKVIARYFDKRNKRELLDSIVKDLGVDYHSFCEYIKTGVNKVDYGFFIKTLRKAEIISEDPDFYRNFSLILHEKGISDFYEGFYLGLEIWREEGGKQLRDFLAKLQRRKKTNLDLLDFIVALSEKTENIITPTYYCDPKSSNVILTYKYGAGLVPGKELCCASRAVLENMLKYKNCKANPLKVQELSCGAEREGSECIYLLEFPEKPILEKRKKNNILERLDSSSSYVFIGKGDYLNSGGVSKMFRSEQKAFSEIGFLEWVMNNPSFATKFPSPKLIASDFHEVVKNKGISKRHFCLEERIEGPSLEELSEALFQRGESYANKLSIALAESDMKAIAFAHTQAGVGKLKEFFDGLSAGGIVELPSYDEGLKEIFYENLEALGINIPESGRDTLNSAFSDIHDVLIDVSGRPSLDTSADNGRIRIKEVYAALRSIEDKKSRPLDEIKKVHQKNRLGFVLDYTRDNLMKFFNVNDIVRVYVSNRVFVDKDHVNRKTTIYDDVVNRIMSPRYGLNHENQEVMLNKFEEYMRDFGDPISEMELKARHLMVMYRKWRGIKWTKGDQKDKRQLFIQGYSSLQKAIEQENIAVDGITTSTTKQELKQLGLAGSLQFIKAVIDSSYPNIIDVLKEYKK